MPKTFYKKVDKNSDVSFSSIFLVLSRFRVFFSEGSSKTLHFCKTIVPKSFYKKSGKIRNQFFLDFFYFVFGGFLARGVRKHHKKMSEKMSGPVIVLASDLPTYHGGHRFFSGGPLGLEPNRRARLRRYDAATEHLTSDRRGPCLQAQ
jgi:hypothetical protein